MSETVMLYILVLAGLDDLKNCKIRNSIIQSGWILGVMLHILDGTAESLIWGIVSIAVTIAAAFPLYRLGGIGAGDIKLWSVISLIYGICFLGEVIIYLFLIAAVFALIKLLWSRSLFERFLNLYRYVFGGNGSSKRYYSLQNDGAGYVIPMAPITACAYFIVLIRGVKF